MSVKIFFITLCILQASSKVKGGGILTRFFSSESNDDENENENNYSDYNENEKSELSHCIKTTQPSPPPTQGKCTCREGNNKHLGRKPLLEEIGSIVKDAIWLWGAASPKKVK